MKSDEDIMLGEISQGQKDKYCESAHVTLEESNP